MPKNSDDKHTFYNLLNQYTGKTAHHEKNSFHFIRILESLKIKPGDLMVSFDVVSLFTKVPVEESLTLLSQHFNKDILALYKHVLTSNYFCVDGQFYEQTDGVAMGSPLSPVIANFYMEDFETKAIKQATPKPAFCTDMLMIISSSGHMGKEN